MRYVLTAVASIAVAALLSGCSGSGSSTATVTATKTVTASAGGASGSDTMGTSGSATTDATNAVRIPNGLTAQLTKVARTAPDSCATTASEDDEVAVETKQTTCVLIQVTLANPTSAAVKVQSSVSSGEIYGPSMDLLTGADQYEAEDQTYGDSEGAPDLPRQLAPGSKCVDGSYYRVPNEQLNVLAVVYSYVLGDDADRFEHTFDRAQDLLD